MYGFGRFYIFFPSLISERWSNGIQRYNLRMWAAIAVKNLLSPFHTFKTNIEW
jgi:hypothetical protein